MRLSHPVRIELERRLAAKDRIIDALNKLLDDPKATPYLRLEASRELTRLLKLGGEPEPRRQWHKEPKPEFLRLLKAAVGPETDRGA